MNRYRRNNIEERFFKVLMMGATAIILLCLFLIVFAIVQKGLPSMSVDMITKTTEDGFLLAKGGGVLNAIIGSLYLAGGATVLAFFLSLSVALYLNIYKKRQSAYVNIVRLCLDVLWGIPSIVYGAFGFTIMLILGIHISLLAGIVVVGIMTMPIMIRAMDEVIMTVPKGLIDASLSLGATRFETAFKVAARQSIPGILTAVLISFGRAIGDAAAVLFTAGFTDYVPTALDQPAATLPLAIFFQLGTPVPEVQGRAYASALILTVIILFISIASRIITRKYSKHKV